MESLDAAKVAALARIIDGSELTVNGPPVDAPLTVESARQTVRSNQDYLPSAYKKAYSQPFLRVLDSVRKIPSEAMLRVGIDAVAQHAPGSPVRAELRRLIAVIDDLFNSFVDAVDQSAINLSLDEQLAPLASFRSSAGMGPFTIPSDSVRSVIDSSVAIVSLPSAFRDHPLLWSTIAHETGGHDIIHADPGLLGEMKLGIYQHLAGNKLPGKQPDDRQKLGMLWAYWMDETSADVFALMNMGPAYILGAVAFFSAFLSQQGSQIKVPHIRTDSGSMGGALDVHPTDVLRLAVAQGVINSLENLDSAKRKFYVQLLSDLTGLVAPGLKHINLKGNLHLASAYGNFSVDMTGQYDMDLMMQTAWQVGEFCAQTKFRNLAVHSIQEIETWDDLDEANALKCCHRLLDAEQVGSEVKPVMLLSAGILASAYRPNSYQQLNRAVEHSLDQSFAKNPLWS